MRTTGSQWRSLAVQRAGRPSSTGRRSQLRVGWPWLHDRPTAARAAAGVAAAGGQAAALQQRAAARGHQAGAEGCAWRREAARQAGLPEPHRKPTWRCACLYSLHGCGSAASPAPYGY